MDCVEQKIKDLRHSIGDVVEAVQEQMWTDKWQKRIFAAYISCTDTEIGMFVRKMIDEEIERMAKEMCDE